MIFTLYAAGAGIIAGACFYLAWWHTDARKFLAGAFFMSSGILFYHYLADVPVPLLGTDAVLTPQINAVRSGIQFILFLLCGYFGFIHRPAGRRPPRLARSSVVLPLPHVASLKAGHGRRVRHPPAP
jgi:uncharacterized protein (DUF486 family)